MPTPEARAIADRSIDERVCCREYPPCQTEAWRVALAKVIDRFAAQRGAELCERLEREFGIPKLVLLGQANAGEITEADKAWANEIISKRTGGGALQFCLADAAQDVLNWWEHLESRNHQGPMVQTLFSALRSALPGLEQSQRSELSASAAPPNAVAPERGIDRGIPQTGGDDARIDVSQGSAGLWYATSPDIPGLLVNARTRDELDEAIPNAIADLKRARMVEQADTSGLNPDAERRDGSNPSAGTITQTGGGDAGKRAREHASAVLYRVTEHLAKTGEWADEDLDALRAGLAMLDSREADLRSSHRKGAEACADILERRARGFASGGHVDAIFSGRIVADELNANARKFRALPIPGE